MRLEPRDSWIEIVKITQEEERQENLLDVKVF